MLQIKLSSKKIAIIILISVLCSFFYIQFNLENVFDDDTSIKTQLISSNQMSLYEEKFTVTGTDGYAVYALLDEVIPWNACIEFTKAVDRNIVVQVFYADLSGQFTPEKSFYSIVEKGESKLVIDLPKENIYYIRVDVMIPEGQEIPSYSINVTPYDVLNYLKIVFSIRNIIQILLILVVLYGLDNMYGCLKKTKIDSSILPILSVVSVMFVILYGQFIRGDAIYMYIDIGRDTIDAYLPRYTVNMGLANVFQNYGYTLHKGFGEFISEGILKFIDPFEWVFLVFDISTSLILSLYLKFIWTCCFAWAFFRKKFRKKETISVCTILWTFGGWFVLWGQHYDFATAYAYFTALLFFLELLIERNKYRVLFPIVLALLTGHSYYFTYFMGVFSVVYVIACGITKKQKAKEILLVILELAIMEVIAVMLSAVQLYGEISSFLQSNRTSSLDVSWIELLYPRNIEYLITYIGRMFSSNFWGLENYSGMFNYYEMAVSYASVLFFIAIVYYFLYREKKKVILIIAGYCICIMMPLVSKLLQFQDNTFRWTVVLSVCTILLTGDFLESVWEHIEQREWKILQKTLVISNIVVVSVLFILSMISKYYSGYLQIDKQSLMHICIVWAVIDIIFLILALENKLYLKKAASFILMFVCFEQVLMNYNVVNERGEIDTWAFHSCYYNDGTIEVVNDLKDIDTSLYRVKKTYQSQFYNDAYMQGYNGVTSYSSASSNELTNFVQNLNIEFLFGHPNYIAIPSEEEYVNELLAVKYCITRNDTDMREGYTEILSKNGYTVYEDLDALPFGYLYTKQLKKEEYLALNKTEERSAAMLLGFYSEEKMQGYEVVNISECELSAEAKKGRAALKSTIIDDIKFENDRYTATVTNNEDEKGMLCIPLIYSDRWVATINEEKVDVVAINGGLLGVEIPQGKSLIEIEYDYDDYKVSLWITVICAVVYPMCTLIWLKRRKKHD